MKKTIMNAIGAAAIGIGLLSLAQNTMANPISYAVSDTFGAGSVTGTITTDGSFGTLALANIASWNLLLSDGVNSVVLQQGVNGGSFNLEGSALSATSTNLTFNYSFTSGPPYTDFYIYNATAIPALQGELCYTSSSNCWGPPGVGAYSVGGDNLSVYSARSGSMVIATVTPVPEPKTILMLLSGLGVMGFLARRRKQKLAA